MPYITQDQRDALDSGGLPADAGELNYCLTKLIRGYVNLKSKPSYQAINDVLGALRGAELEFYRRVAVDYEDAKIIANGDVYD
jgi:hypothetical protein